MPVKLGQQSDDVIAASKFSQQLIEQKERELHESIAFNYTRIKDVERELRELQMQVKLTAEPKKQALEMLRKKIEVQNNKVLAVRRRYEVAAQAFRQLEAELNHEEALKQQLCDELNQVVTTSVSSQLEHFEQLKVKLEALHGGAARSSSTPEHPVNTPTPTGQAGPATAAAAEGPAAQPAPHQQQRQAGSQTQDAQQHQQQPAHLQQGSSETPGDAAAAAAKAAAAVAALGAAATAAAEAARNRHVQLPGRLRNKGSSGGQEGGAQQHAQPQGKGQPAAAGLTDLQHKGRLL